MNKEQLRSKYLKAKACPTEKATSPDNEGQGSSNPDLSAAREEVRNRGRVYKAYNEVGVGGNTSLWGSLERDTRILLVAGFFGFL